ncbi:MAG: histidinol-phosphatase HisJ family protein [Lachnospiraceae bacterium]|nr:histidinol-phosphatase HisJ family protein [Lachnospiraceae bacterium]
MFVDYHMHSKFSFDAEEELDDICQKAIERGLSEIAITDHMDIFSDKAYGYILDCEKWYPALCACKEKYAGKLKVLRGIELGQPQANPAEARAFLERYPLDFIIGSVHNIENDVDCYDFDYTKVDYHGVYDSYMRYQLELAKNYDFDILAHPTYPSRYVFERTGVTVDYPLYWDRYVELFRTVIERGKGIEVNLSGIARNCGDIMPTMDLLKLYRSLGGEVITMGSDAHVVEQVGCVSRKGCEILKEAGFKYMSLFDERKMCMVEIP